MSLIKTPAEIQSMVRGGAILTAALQSAVNAVRPGVTMADLDQIATSVIEQAGGSPSFRGYRSGASIPFPATLCISRNEEVVHGIGTRKIKLEDDKEVLCDAIGELLFKTNSITHINYIESILETNLSCHYSLSKNFPINFE